MSQELTQDFLIDPYKEGEPVPQLPEPQCQELGLNGNERQWEGWVYWHNS